MRGRVTAIVGVGCNFGWVSCYGALVASRRNAKWPREIVEVPVSGDRVADPRAEDPHATQKITAFELEEVLKRTKSGFRRAVRESKPDLATEAPSSSSQILEQAGPPEPSGPELPQITPIPAPIILVKPERDADLVIPRTRTDVVTPSHEIAVAPPPRSRWVLAFVVAFLTTAALGIGYLLGRGQL